MDFDEFQYSLVRTKLVGLVHTSSSQSMSASSYLSAEDEMAPGCNFQQPLLSKDEHDFIVWAEKRGLGRKTEPVVGYRRRPPLIRELNSEARNILCREKSKNRRSTHFTFSTRCQRPVRAMMTFFNPVLLVLLSLHSLNIAVAVSTNANDKKLVDRLLKYEHVCDGHRMEDKDEKLLVKNERGEKFDAKDMKQGSPWLKTCAPQPFGLGIPSKVIEFWQDQLSSKDSKKELQEILTELSRIIYWEDFRVKLNQDAREDKGARKKVHERMEKLLGKASNTGHLLDRLFNLFSSPKAAASEEGKINNCAAEVVASLMVGDASTRIPQDQSLKKKCGWEYCYLWPDVFDEWRKERNILPYTVAGLTNSTSELSQLTETCPKGVSDAEKDVRSVVATTLVGTESLDDSVARVKEKMVTIAKTVQDLTDDSVQKMLQHTKFVMNMSEKSTKDREWSQTCFRGGHEWWTLAKKNNVQSQLTSNKGKKNTTLRVDGEANVEKKEMTNLKNIVKKIEFGCADSILKFYLACLEAFRSFRSADYEIKYHLANLDHLQGDVTKAAKAFETLFPKSSEQTKAVAKADGKGKKKQKTDVSKKDKTVTSDNVRSD